MFILQGKKTRSFENKVFYNFVKRKELCRIKSKIFFLNIGNLYIKAFKLLEDII